MYFSGNTCVCITDKSIILGHHMCITTVANWEFTCFHLNNESFFYCKDISSKFDFCIRITLKKHIFLFEDL